MQLLSQRHAKPSRASGVKRGIAIFLAAVLGFVPVFMYAYAASLLSGAHKVDISSLLVGDDQEAPPAPPSDGEKGQWVNILLMGSDSRAGASGSIGGRVTDGMRNDTTLIMHISADRKRVELISIPRDSRVAIPDCRLFDGTTVKGWTGKFNIAFSNGGIQGNPAEAAACTINAVQQLTGIYISHYVVVDMAGFVKMIDALGGVPMCIPEHYYSSSAKVNLKAGPQVLNGHQAVGYARMRKAEIGDVDGSDIGRIERQHQLLANTAKAAMSKNLLFDLPSLTEFLKAGAESMTMDPELGDINTLMGLAFSLRGVSTDNVVFTTVPWEYAPGFSDVLWTSDADSLFKRIRDDKAIKGDSISTIGNASIASPAAGNSESPVPGDSADPAKAESAVCSS